MRIVQTFWTGKTSPFEGCFGWLHPEYNLMAWTLSCLSIREFYDDVILYTDNFGQKCLVDILQLPYSEVHTNYGAGLCLPRHWAYAKIRTYSLQEEPFVHIDGDVFLPSALRSEILSSPLITQNGEYGTRYYDEMLNAFLRHPEITVPDWLADFWETRPVVSHNMGIFGGSDLDFIHRYCKEVESLLQKNRLNDSADRRSRVNANVIFEQMLFAAMAKKENREVRTVLKSSYADRGYTSSLFCNFERWEETGLLHIVGGNKRVLSVCQAMEHRLFKDYPEYFLRIAGLFPERHPYVGTPMEELLVEQARHNDSDLLRPSKNGDYPTDIIVERNPQVRILHSSEREDCYTLHVPSIFSTGCQKVVVNPLGVNILNLLEEGERTFREMTEILTPCFSQELRSNVLEHIVGELKYLLHYGVIFIHKQPIINSKKQKS